MRTKASHTATYELSVENAVTLLALRTFLDTATALLLPEDIPIRVAVDGEPVRLIHALALTYPATAARYATRTNDVVSA